MYKRNALFFFSVCVTSDIIILKESLPLFSEDDMINDLLLSCNFRNLSFSHQLRRQSVVVKFDLAKRFPSPSSLP